MTGCVLAGGKSTRMGRDKSLLEIGGRTLAALQVERLRGIFAHVIASANDPAPFLALGVEVVPDRLGSGPLAGIAAALAGAPAAPVFCCAVDMPFISAPLVRYLCSLGADYDIVVPRGAPEPGRSSPLEPTHAVYAKRCLARFEECLAAGRFKLDAAFEGLRVRVVEPAEIARFDPAGRSFRNINTPEEYRRALEEVA